MIQSFAMTLEKPIGRRYLDLIISGEKTYEGRSGDKLHDWNLSIGKHIRFYDRESAHWVAVVVTNLWSFETLEAAFSVFGNELLPGYSYHDFVSTYRGIYQNGELDRFGFLAIGFDVVSSSLDH